MAGCKECGSPKSERAIFCCQRCRLRFNNRRMLRGAELYDIFMAMRFDRERAKDERLWSSLCALASVYRDADKARREGRKSWDDEAVKRVPYFAHKEGDRR